MRELYDEAKAKALFEVHIRPVVNGGGFGPMQWVESSLSRSGYVVTPEMLRMFRHCVDAMHSDLEAALSSHLHDLDIGENPSREWTRAIR